MRWLHFLRKHVNAERAGWFGAGLSTAAVGVVAYQFVGAFMAPGGLPAPQLTTVAAAVVSPSPTRTPRPSATALPSFTPRPTRTPAPTRTPYPTRTPTPVVRDPAGLLGAVATLVVETRGALRSVSATAEAR